MPNPWLNEHKSTATMKYFLIHVQLIYIELKHSNTEFKAILDLVCVPNLTNINNMCLSHKKTLLVEYQVKKEIILGSTLKYHALSKHGKR